MAAGALLSVLAGLFARRRTQVGGYWPLLVMWLAGIVAILAANTPMARLNSRFAEAWNQTAKRIAPSLGLVALALSALAIRAFGLEHIPRNFGGDEGTWAMEGMAMLQDGLANPFATRWFSFPSLSFLAWGASMVVFGESVAGVRALSALLGTAAVLSTFALASELWGRRVAWFAAAALAFGHYHLHYSRIAVNNIGDALVSTLALWLLVRGIRLRRTEYLAWAGAVIGLGWYGYFGSRLIGIIIAAYLAWRSVAERGFLKRHGRGMVTMACAAVTVAAPLLLHYAAHPVGLVERTRQVSIFGSGWLAREQEITGQSAISLLLKQLWRSASAFNYTLDPTFWYRPGIPLLDFISGPLFILGLASTTGRIRRSESALLLGWFSLAVLTGWVVTENPPSSQRLVIVTPALAILVALGLDWIIERGTRVSGGFERGWRWVASGLLVAAAVANIRFYFAVYTPSRTYGNPTAEVTTVLGRYLAVQSDDAAVFFHGAPDIYWDFGTLRFLARDVAGQNVPPVGEGPKLEPDVTRGMRFVFVPSRLDELDDIRMRYPGGVESQVTSEVDGRLLYALYEVAATGG